MRSGRTAVRHATALVVMVVAAAVFVGAPGVSGAGAADGGSGSGSAGHGARGADAAAGAPRWQWPVTRERIVRAYAAPPSPYAAGHRGIDLAAEPGTPVVAPSDATVHFVGVVVDRPVVTLDHGSGVLSSYEPLVAEGLRAGDAVARGDPLGVVSSGAHCTDVCLHVGVRVDSAYVSPLLFFDRVPRSVLLPVPGRERG
jgi:murein DD-endopeptidase MepM/ murein hydrolase activator NlpD